jgi:hypothetical protein
MAGIAVSSRVVARNGIGRFIADCEQAATATVRDLITEGEGLSKGMAPVGSKPDPRGTPIIASFFSQMLSRTSGVWGNFSPWALHQEFGTGAHVIMGNPFLSFFWDNAGRMWVPGLYGEPDFVNHPGHGAQPFLRPAYKAISARAMAVARRHYPG